MKRIVLLLVFVMSPVFGEWKLVWNDEFDKPGAPDPKKWNYEVGFVRNQEEQYYTKARRQNARVENGSLIIEARAEKYKNPAFVSEDNESWQKNRKTANYTSACLITQNLFSWKYGKLEIRAKLPVGKGVWPAFWMMGQDASKVGWPRCGEIDVMEYVTSTPKTIYGTAHWPGKDPADASKIHTSKGFTIGEEAPDAWHTYGIEWDEKEIIFRFDGKEYGRFDIKQANDSVSEGMGDDNNPFRKPYYLLINLAIGGSWGGAVDPKVFPQKLQVDYVRIYQKKEKKT